MRVPAGGGGEIGLLANTFNDMAAALADQQQENAALLATLEQRVAERTRELAREAAERRRAEEALLQAQKMEAIGQLTGGIAHDFNNLLMAVLGNLELAEIRFGGPGRHPAQRYLAQARHSAERGARLTRDLLAFARRQSLDVASLDVERRRSAAPTSCCAARSAPWCGSITSRARSVAGARRCEPDRAGHPEPGDQCARRDAGRRHDHDRDREHNGRRSARPAELPQGDYVRLAVSDTGSGMSEEVLAKCLEPFFTTKEVGKGSGLGLSVVHGIATQSGGTVEIGSEAGPTALSFSVYLPRAAADLAEDREAETAATGAERRPIRRARAAGR